MRSRAYVFTWNNPPENAVDILRTLDCRYIVYGRERAPSTGTQHLQGYVYWSNGKTNTAARRILPGCHIERARGTFAQNYAYCTKEGDFVARGDPPVDDGERGVAEKERWNDAWNCAKAGRVEEIAPDIRVRCYGALKKIERDYMPRVAPLDTVCGIWIHGLSGSGKTRSVLGAYPESYIKPRNIWWDGYQGEEIVLLDDVDRYDVKFGGLLKHWADFAPFIAECKGGSQRIRPKKFIVTSQYSIEEIWTDEETRSALNRRFTVIHKLSGQDIILV